MATPFDALFAKYAEISGVPQQLIEAVARTESSLNPNAIGDNGRSWGLFQLYEPTARALGFAGPMRDMLDPETATRWITPYMREIIDRQGGIENLNLNRFYSEYNSGDPSLWERSQQVAGHVQNFLENFAQAATTLVDDYRLLTLTILAIIVLSGTRVRRA